MSALYFGGIFSVYDNGSVFRYIGIREMNHYIFFFKF